MQQVGLDMIDVVSGMVLGSDANAGDLEGKAVGMSPLMAIRDSVRKALLKAPCVVSFSGGRDSSALLAVALDVARSEGLPEPVAVTARLGVEEAEESRWQELVVQRLGVREWERVQVGDDLDLLGRWGTQALCSHGLRYPQNVHFVLPLMACARGGSFVSGAGGDELFEPHRWARAGLVLTGAVKRQVKDVLVVGAALAPGPLRSRVHYGRDLEVPPWLRRQGRSMLLRRVRRWVEGDKVSYDKHLNWWSKSRYLRHGQVSFELVAAGSGAQWVAPFSEPDVLWAFASHKGRVGYSSRTGAMRELFGDVLPTDIVERRTKATFSGPLVGPATRAFMEEARPDKTLPAELVDCDTLEECWRRETVDVRSLMALQMCWLGSHGHADGVSRSPLF